MIFFVLIIKVLNDVAMLIDHDLFIVHHLLTVLLLILMTPVSCSQLMLVPQVLLKLSLLVFIEVVHVNEVLFLVLFIAIAVVIVLHVDFELLLLLHHLPLLLLLHASHQLLLELLLQLLLHVHADCVRMTWGLFLLLFIFVVLIGLSPLLSILFIDLSDVRATRVIVVSLGVAVDWLVSFLFLVIVLIVAHVFLVLVLFNGLSSDHVVVVHHHHVVALVVILLITFFLIIIVLVIIHILLLVHLLVLVLLKEELLLLVLLERGLRGEVAWEVSSCNVQAIVVLGTQQ